jgi:AmmeMemoRadiSam system protein A
MDDRLSESERKLLLQMARQAIYDAVQGNPILLVDTRELPENLRKEGACFVTLTTRGELRGCIGALEAYQSLVEDVREHAAGAALQDYRFPPVTPDEVGELEIEISRLTPPQPLQYHKPDELLTRLRRGVDGVILRDGPRRATFLPQVWEKLPDPEDFLNHLCTKMGASPNLWRFKPLQVFTYQVEEFHEEQVTQ